MFTDIPQHSAGVPDGNHIVRNTFRDHASGSNDGILSDMYTRNNDYACTNPGVFSDIYIFIELQSPFPKLRIYRMARCRNSHIRPKHDFISYINVPIIHKRQI